jgi:hypothetical protein
MNRVAVPLLLILALIGIAVAGYWLKRPPEAQAVACVNPLAGCVFSHHGAEVKVTFSSQPSPLKAFQLNVRAPGVAKISAEFQMNGMEMGFNRYDLRPTKAGVFTSSITLPVCVSGRRDWTMFLAIDDTHYTLPFSTQ